MLAEAGNYAAVQRMLQQNPYWYHPYQHLMSSTEALCLQRALSYYSRFPNQQQNVQQNSVINNPTLNVPNISASPTSSSSSSSFSSTSSTSFQQIPGTTSDKNLTVSSNKIQNTITNNNNNNITTNVNNEIINISSNTNNNTCYSKQKVGKHQKTISRSSTPTSFTNATLTVK